MPSIAQPIEISKMISSHLWFGKELRFLESGLTRNGGAFHLADRVAVIVGESGTLKSRLAYSFLANGFKHEAEFGYCGAVLLTSEGINDSDLREAIAEWDAKIDNETEEKKRVLVRPVLPRFLSSSNLVFRLRLCIREMKKRIGIANGDIENSWKVRVVIDNWNSMVDAHASLQRDNQLLQSVFALLRNEGVLGLIVATQPGSPAANDESTRKHDITRMEATRIHCWPVNFFGDRRIAVCTSVPGRDGRRTSIAELGKYNGSEYKLEIGNDFDFYEDLESGRARRVKLKVKLYSGFDDTDEHFMQPSSTYSGEVSALFGDLYSRNETRDDVVSFEGINSYDSFKEYIQNLDRGQLDETLVFQVDEFWSGQSISAPFATIRNEFADEREIDTDGFSESNKVGSIPSQLFRVPLHKDFGLLLADRAAWYKARDIAIDENCLVSDGEHIIAMTGGLDPDFSSMLAPADESPLQKLQSYGTDKGKDKLREMIAEAKASESKAAAEGKQKPDSPVKKLTVGDVWNAMCVGGDVFFETPRKLIGMSLLAPSWELFLRACQIVALQSGKRSFDVDLRTSESLSSLVLEIWISTIANRLMFTEVNKIDAIYHTIFVTTSESSERSTLNLKQLVAKYAIEFEYALRSAIRFLPGRYREAKSPLSAPDREAVAVRTWFATAVHCQHANRDLTPLRVPGKFCVRGDWYLAVAKGSRSMSLAESAIAKLMSESMNRKRLREGIGLPVVKSSKMANVESALLVPEPNLSSYRPLTLKEISSAEPVKPDRAQNGFSSHLVRLFRSEIPDYDASSEEFFLTIVSLLRKLTPVTDFEMAPPYVPISADGRPAVHVVEPRIRQIIEDFAGTQIAW
jgi:KaiC/GvpD/RAD55 family RecA-like ATPase